jgi:hypothetical protein
MLAPTKGGPADPACPARPPRRTFQAKPLPMAPVSRPSVPRDGPCRRKQRTRSQAETDPGHYPHRPFPIDSSQPPAASSLGGFPTRAVRAPSCALTPRPASENLHLSGQSPADPTLQSSVPKSVIHAGRSIRNGPMSAVRTQSCLSLPRQRRLAKVLKQKTNMVFRTTLNVRPSRQASRY